MSAIIIASVVDENFLPLIEIVANSIASSATPGRAIEYHVFYAGPESRRSRRLAVWRRGDMTIKLHAVDNSWNRFGNTNGFPPAALLRLSLPQLLPDHSRVLYLDADLVVEADLGELFDTPLDGKPLGATIDRIVVEMALGDGAGRDEMRDYLLRVVGRHTEEQVRDYRQSGVMLMDLDALRASDFTRIATQAMELRGPQFRYADQCLVNFTMQGRIAELDPRWNATPYGMASEDRNPTLRGFETYARLQRTEPRIIHYAGNKPWNMPLMPFGHCWWRHAFSSGVAFHFLPGLALRKLEGLGRRIRRLMT